MLTKIQKVQYPTLVTMFFNKGIFTFLLFVYTANGFLNGCKPNDNTEECDSRGTCVNNVCVCDRRPNPEEIISGKYCECDNYSCNRVNGQICGGPDHGTCVCNKCICNENWTGDDCSCSTLPCGKGISIYADFICSDAGKCVCGKCVCDKYRHGDVCEMME